MRKYLRIRMFFILLTRLRYWSHPRTQVPPPTRNMWTMSGCLISRFLNRRHPLHPSSHPHPPLLPTFISGPEYLQPFDLTSGRTYLDPIRYLIWKSFFFSLFFPTTPFVFSLLLSMFYLLLFSDLL